MTAEWIARLSSPPLTVDQIMEKESSRSVFDLSIIIAFHNMRREAERTLYSLTSLYQRETAGISYEVIAIDNGSTEPLDRKWVEALGENFRYIYFEADLPSPVRALNHAGRLARGRFVCVCIDGARIFSPGVLHYSMLAAKLYPDPLIYTLGMHIGRRQQPHLAVEGYSAVQEDMLIASVDWKSDGYSLFDISSIAISSGTGYFSRLAESNCITMARSRYQDMGGFDERFQSPGGGLANLDFFNRANIINGVQPVMLLGEATFHQFHGGTATNVPLKDHPWPHMAAEYEKIRGRPYALAYRPPVYFGTVHEKCRHLLVGTGDGMESKRMGKA